MHVFIHRVPKKRHLTHGGNSVNSQPISKFFFTFRFSSTFAAKYFANDLIAPHYTTLWNIDVKKNVQQSQTNAVINDKLQGAVAT